MAWLGGGRGPQFPAPCLDKVSRKEPSPRGACSSGPGSELAALRVRTPTGGASVSRRLSLPCPSLLPTEQASRSLAGGPPGQAASTGSSRKRSAVPGPVCRAGGPACLTHDGWSQELRTLLSQSPAALGQAHGLSWAVRARALATPSLVGLGSLFLSLALPWPPASLQRTAHAWQ